MYSRETDVAVRERPCQRLACDLLIGPRNDAPQTPVGFLWSKNDDRSPSRTLQFRRSAHDVPTTTSGGFSRSESAGGRSPFESPV